MGADQHAWVEVKRPRFDGSTRWVLLDEEIFDHPYFNPERERDQWNYPKTSRPLVSRNYTLFGLMADVRNGRGFAGIDIGDPLTPLAEPRGVPDDASFGYLAEVDGWDVDGHSHTWFTLPELIDNPLYDQRLVRRGVVDGVEYERLKREGGMPKSWAGAVTGQNIVTVTIDEYEAGKRAPAATSEMIAKTLHWENQERAREFLSVEHRTQVVYVWEDSLRDSIGELLGAVQKLREWADDAGNHWKGEPVPYEDIRIVVFYDN